MFPLSSGFLGPSSFHWLGLYPALPDPMTVGAFPPAHRVTHARPTAWVVAIYAVLASQVYLREVTIARLVTYNTKIKLTHDSEFLRINGRAVRRLFSR